MSFLIFIAVLLVLILVHEFGHFVFAKIFKVRVDEFGIGYPPKALKIAKIGETEYTLNWLPFGGFVRLFGEEKSDKISDDEKLRSLEYKKPWQKILILFAGAFFNFLLGWFLFAYVFFSGVPLFWDKNYVDNSTLTVAGVMESAPAELSGIELGDKITAIHLKDDPDLKPKMLSPDFVADFISKHPGEKIVVVLERQGEQPDVKVEITPRQGVLKEAPARAAVGMSMTLVSERQYGVLESLYLGLKSSWQVVIDVLEGLWNLFKGALTLNADLKHVAGPVGIASMVGDAAQVGFAYLLYFMALISINLAVINLLPIPALDGGRIVFALYEWIFGRKAPAWLENGINFVGFALLILLMLAITYNDVVRLIYK